LPLIARISADQNQKLPLIDTDDTDPEKKNLPLIYADDRGSKPKLASGSAR